MNINAIRAEFPILKERPYGYPLAYLDSAATAQKPNVVIDCLKQYYSTQNANVHRGMHYLSEKATERFEQAREIIQQFIRAKHARECIFVRGTTEGINLVAQSFGEMAIHPGDEILISGMEHHSNIVPWQLLCQRKNAILKVIPLTLEGELKLEEVDKLLTPKTKLLAVSYVSNALGTVNPIQALIQKAHANNTYVLVDGAQAIPHLPVNVQDLDCDFFVFSSHKAYGPTGVGVLYAKEALLNLMPPYHGGGDMISKVSFSQSTYKDIPHKFEAGTPAIAEAIAFSQALQFISNIGFDAILKHEQALMTYTEQALNRFSDIEIIGRAKQKRAVISFTLDGVHPHDIATILDQHAVAIRSGHHCAMPIMDFYNIPATARISLGLYNNEQDIDQCIQALQKVRTIFKK